MEHEA